MWVETTPEASAGEHRPLEHERRNVLELVAEAGER